MTLVPATLKRIVPTIAAAVVAAALTACGAPVPSGSSGGASLKTTRVASWMTPAATKMPNLLYVSNATNVTVYNYNDGSGITQVGTLTGFATPQGLCDDKAGDVWVSDYASRTMFEYAHGGTTPITKITSKSGFPYACAIDNATGNLAVSYWHPNAHYRNYADVVVYPPGSNFGQSYGPYTGFYRAYFLTYDNKSNLFTTGYECGYSECYREQPYIPVYELPAGQAQFVRIARIQRQRAISGIVWANPTVLLGTGESGPKGSGAVKVQFTGQTAKVIGTVKFAQTFLTYGFTLRAHLAIVPDFASNAVQIYNISDGSLVSSFTQGLSQPFSVAVSQRK